MSDIITETIESSQDDFVDNLIDRFAHAFWVWLMSVLLGLAVLVIAAALILGAKSNITSIRKDSIDAAGQARLEAIGAVDTILLAPEIDD
jgi:hypothetical protein